MDRIEHLIWDSSENRGAEYADWTYLEKLTIITHSTFDNSADWSYNYVSLGSRISYFYLLFDEIWLVMDTD